MQRLAFFSPLLPRHHHHHYVSQQSRLLLQPQRAVCRASSTDAQATASEATPAAATAVRNMRKSFDNFPNAQMINWFPGHMAKTQKQMVRMMKHKHLKFDVLIEVRDARIPFTSSAVFEKIKNLKSDGPEAAAAASSALDDSALLGSDSGGGGGADGDEDSKVETMLSAADVSALSHREKNIMFQELKKRERHVKRVIVFNKSDLVTPQDLDRIRRYFDQRRSLLIQKLQSGESLDPESLNVDTEVVFTSCLEGSTGSAGLGSASVRKIIDACMRIMKRKSTEHSGTSQRFKTIPYMFMIMGIPNVGKSSIINTLRKQYKVGAKKSAKEGPNPGVTRQINGFTVCEKPHPCVLLDTPGVLIPHIESSEQAYKLAATGAIRMLSQKKSTLSSVHEDALCDYLLFKLNQQKLFDYVKACGLKEPVDELSVVLESLAKRYNFSGGAGAVSADDEEDSFNDLSASRHQLDEEDYLDMLLADQKVAKQAQEKKKKQRYPQPTAAPTAATDADAPILNSNELMRSSEWWNRSATHFLKMYRSGALGKLVLDEMPLV